MVERANASLKDEFGERSVTVRGALKVMAHLMFGVLAWTADQLMKLPAAPRPAPDKILLHLANCEGHFVEITPEASQVTSGEGVPFETSSSIHRQRAA
jgi:hypothetical protein